VTLDIGGITFTEMGSTPLYLQAVEILRTGINEGRIRAGDAQPSERELSLVAKLSRVTGGNAIDTLSREVLLCGGVGAAVHLLREPADYATQ
jgi:DNA-binding GntR family transcriptional regulator